MIMCTHIANADKPAIRLEWMSVRRRLKHLALSQPHRFNNNNIFFIVIPYLNMNHSYRLCMYISVGVRCLYLYRSLLSISWICSTYSLQEREKKNRAQFDSVDTVVFPSERTQEQNTNKMFVISFPLCQNDNSKDKMPFILYFLFSGIQFTETKHKRANHAIPKLYNVTHALYEITLSLCGRCAVCSLFSRARANPNCWH